MPLCAAPSQINVFLYVCTWLVHSKITSLQPLEGVVGVHRNRLYLNWLQRRAAPIQRRPTLTSSKVSAEDRSPDERRSRLAYLQWLTLSLTSNDRVGSVRLAASCVFCLVTRLEGVLVWPCPVAGHLHSVVDDQISIRRRLTCYL